MSREPIYRTRKREAIAMEGSENLPPVSPALVEFLEEKFAQVDDSDFVTLSAEGALKAMARQHGREEVIRICRDLSRATLGVKA